MKKLLLCIPALWIGQTTDAQTIQPYDIISTETARVTHTSQPGVYPGLLGGMSHVTAPVVTVVDITTNTLRFSDGRLSTRVRSRPVRDGL